jgi:hypothetical protein
MSHNRAYAFVASVPEADRLHVLRAAVECLFYVSDALEADALGSGIGAAALLSERAIERAEETLVDAVNALRADVEAHKEAEQDADARAVEAEARLEDKLQQDPDELRAMKEEVETLKAEACCAVAKRDEALARVDSVKTLVESHSDLVAMARKFTSAALAAGVPIKHVRAVRKAGGQ